MKILSSAATLIVFAVACSPAWSYASGQRLSGVQSDTAAPGAIVAHDPRHAAPAAARPVISVGVTDPDTQLNLPWFLTDIINAVNTRTSANDLLRTVGHDL